MRRLIVLAVLAGSCAAIAAEDKTASPPSAKSKPADTWIPVYRDSDIDSLAPVEALTPSQVFDRVKASVFVVRTLDAKGKTIGQGSGVLLPSRKIGTNCHVLKNGVRFRVGGGKQLVPAILWASDEDKDICLLEAIGLKGKPVQLGQATRLKVGDPVYAVGAPQGFELSLSNGIVSQLRGGPPPYIQTTAAISPGSSGGGLFNAEGQLVGFTTLYIEGGQSLNFAMPVEWISRLRADAKPTSRDAPPGPQQPAPNQVQAPRDYGPIGFKDLVLGASIAQHQQTYAMKCDPAGDRGQVSCRVQFIDPNEPIIYRIDPRNNPISTVAGVQLDFIDLLYEQGYLISIGLFFNDRNPFTGGLDKVIEALTEKFSGTRSSVEAVTYWAATCRENNFQVTWNLKNARVRVVAAVSTQLVWNAQVPCSVAWYGSKLEYKSNDLVKREQEAQKSYEDRRRKDL